MWIPRLKPHSTVQTKFENSRRGYICYHAVLITDQIETLQWPFLLAQVSAAGSNRPHNRSTTCTKSAVAFRLAKVPLAQTGPTTKILDTLK